MKTSRPLLVVGKEFASLHEKIADECKRGRVEVEFVASSEEAAAWLSERAPRAVAVELGGADAEPTCLRVRSHANLANVPIVGLTAEVSDLGFAEMYGWGGDDIVPAHATRSLLMRLMTLEGDMSLHPPAMKGIAVVADADRRRRILTARVLRNSGYDVRFALEADEAVVASLAEGVALVVADADLLPGGGMAAAHKAREKGGSAPWVIAAEPKKMGLVRAQLKGLARVAVTDGFAPPENVLFVANELGRAGLAESRASARLLYGTVVAFRLAGRDEDSFGCTYNISAGGLYVRTLAPLSSGDEVWVELTPPRSDRRVRLDGRVAWRRRFGPIESATVPPGFGIQILDGAAADLTRYRSGYKSFLADTLGNAG